ncbi:hypothetical protein B0H66DRAFT_92932 [Apodospora peruviana]|uniref:GA4 desaturase n=1 Tax=Apodospora peruviana TaxID=516989 RepID=A0AAE0IU47_9PEZI|nr:hypothetical protein B0H66DRAFT_92932 [Apodospora peruviana]
MPHRTDQQQSRGGLSSMDLPTERGTLSFIKDLPKYKQERPYRWAGALEPSQEHKRTNIQLESHEGIDFADLRPIIDHPEKLSLRRDGFQILRRAPGQQDPVLGGDSSVLESYLSTLALDIKDLLSAEAVYCVNFVFRQCTPSSLETPNKIFFEPPTAVKPDVPAFPAHADFTRGYGETVIRESLTQDEATRYLTDEHQIWLVNAWKPLYRPVQNAPLALCDPASISIPDDVLEVDIASPTRVSGATYLKHNPLQRQEWFWCSDQTPDEISLFKSWDSDPQSAVPYVPHCAVRLEREQQYADANEDGKKVLRDSIEARMVVVLRKDDAGL